MTSMISNNFLTFKSEVSGLFCTFAAADLESAISPKSFPLWELMFREFILDAWDDHLLWAGNFFYNFSVEKLRKYVIF